MYKISNSSMLSNETWQNYQQSLGRNPFFPNGSSHTKPSICFVNNNVLLPLIWRNNDVIITSSLIITFRIFLYIILNSITYNFFCRSAFKLKKEDQNKDSVMMRKITTSQFVSKFYCSFCDHSIAALELWVRELFRFPTPGSSWK